jgi:nucleoside phosphorylase
MESGMIVRRVCALPVELAAAQKMLDEEHEDLEQDENDNNLYALGQVGGHNVVLACLSAGQTGIGSVAAVATQLKATTCKWIRFGLMVGIGGGVPSKEDIRLGDVVVSQDQLSRETCSGNAVLMSTKVQWLWDSRTPC